MINSADLSIDIHMLHLWNIYLHLTQNNNPQRIKIPRSQCEYMDLYIYGCGYWWMGFNSYAIREKSVALRPIGTHWDSPVLWPALGVASEVPGIILKVIPCSFQGRS